jgi:hypothetical protein
MRFDGLAELRAGGADALVKGPVCVILCEDGSEVDSTIRHHLAQGFRRVIVFAQDACAIDPALEDKVIRVRFDPGADGASETAVNGVIDILPAGTWMAWLYNAEYLFYPFCEDRSIGELAAFCTEERRDSVLSYVVDLYAPDLSRHPDAVDTSEAHFDRSGYYALVRRGKDRNPKERQLDFYGGLRWRFEEHVPEGRRRIDRIAIFRTKPGLQLRPDHTLTDEEYNTYACPWHNSPTAAIASFRTAKALKRNPGSRRGISTFTWPNAARFGWSSQQLLDLGLMEPGQWF